MPYPYDEEDDFYSIFKKNPYLTPPFVGPGQSRTAGTFPGPTGPPGPQLPGPGIGTARMPPLNAPNVQPTFGQRLGQGVQNPDFLTAIAQILMAQKGGKYGGYAALAGGETAAAIKDRQRQEDLDRQAKLQREIENRREVEKIQMEAAKIKNEQQRYEYLRRKDEELAASRVRDDARETLKMASAQGLDISVPDFQDLREKAGWGNVNMAGPKYVVSLKTGHLVKYRPNSQYDDPAKFTRPDIKAIAEENQKAELQRLKDEREAKGKKPDVPSLNERWLVLSQKQIAGTITPIESKELSRLESRERELRSIGPSIYVGGARERQESGQEFTNKKILKEGLTAFSTVDAVLQDITKYSKRVNTKSGLFGRTSGGLRQLKAAAGLDVDVKLLQSKRGELATLIRTLGEKGNLAEGDVRRAIELIPAVTDTKEEAEAKLSDLGTILKARRTALEKYYGGGPSEDDDPMSLFK